MNKSIKKHNNRFTTCTKGSITASKQKGKKMDVYYLHVGEQNFHRNFICFPQRKDGNILGEAMHIYMKEAFCIGKTPTRAFIIHSFDDS